MEVLLVVDNRVRVVGALKLDVLAKLKEAFEHENKHKMALRRMGIPDWKEPYRIATWKDEPDWSRAAPVISVPRGGTSRVVEILSRGGYDVRVEDRRENGMPIGLPETRRELYEFQRQIVEVACDREQCMIRAPTGSGKTSAGIAIASRVGVPTLVVVPNRALLEQWHSRVREELGLRDGQVGVVKGGKYKLRPVTIAVQLSVTKHSRNRDFREYFGAVILDEMHTAPANTCFEAIDAMPARFRIGISADSRRKDQKEFLMRDLFGEVALDVKREDLVASGHVLDVEVVAVPTGFEAPWYGLEDQDDGQFELSEGSGEDVSAEAKRIDFVRLVREMSESEARNDLVVRLVRAEAAAGRQVLVMAHLREHCMRLGQVLSGMGTRTGYLLGGSESAPEFRRTVGGLKDGSVQVGVGTYKAIGTGIDLPRVSVGVAVTPIAGNRQFFGQARGRLCRTSVGKSGARMLVLWDERVVPRHLDNLIAWNAKSSVLVDGKLEPARQWRKARRVG